MKLLFALFHAAVASQVVFDSLDPSPAGSFGTPVTREQSLGLQFRNVDVCGSVKLEYVNFTVSTENIENNSTWLQVALCPAENGLPKCANNSNVAPQRFPVTAAAKRVQYSWVPSTDLTLRPATLYWFVLSSNAEQFNQAVIWLDGLKRFSTANDPKNDVLTAFTLSEAGDWASEPPKDNRAVSSMVVVARDV
ncbi:Aste57867_9579 [Aphanomyces stellatus]|uniref:Aste57867_9579 protein n=1 Tax=Aphanomyces stellatus TaxID=120398 RepID=A0A485KN52_9STRA|nr:hypothetical protein As57867_009541 [Aphanomyces stellatus]VFT86458.1 Aste57867_9579 [Aphanomyces stellatus]